VTSHRHGGVTVQILQQRKDGSPLRILNVHRNCHLAAATASMLATTSFNHRNSQTAHAPITERRADSQRDNTRVTVSVYVTTTAVCQLLSSGVYDVSPLDIPLLGHLPRTFPRLDNFLPRLGPELVMGWVHPWVGLGGDLTA